jgi:hypothetical protein
MYVFGYNAASGDDGIVDLAAVKTGRTALESR